MPFKVQLKYRCAGRSFSEIWGCGGLIQDILTKLNNPAFAAGILSGRPAGCTLPYAEITDLANPRLGTPVKLPWEAINTGVAAQDPDVVNSAALVWMMNNNIKLGSRIIRCWRDDYIQLDPLGTPILTAPAEGALLAQLTALNLPPLFGPILIQKKAAGNFFPILSVQPLVGDLSNLNLNPADYAALGPPTRATVLLIGGKKIRNLLGIRGRYNPYALPGSPIITINYKVINGDPAAPPINSAGVYVRAIPTPTVGTITKYVLVDWRSRKTADPIDRVRGRGSKALTRQ